MLADKLNARLQNTKTIIVIGLINEVKKRKGLMQKTVKDKQVADRVRMQMSQGQLIQGLSVVAVSS